MSDHRIQALRAKARATPHPAEAESFYRKADELDVGERPSIVEDRVQRREQARSYEAMAAEFDAAAARWVRLGNPELAESNNSNAAWARKEAARWWTYAETGRIR